MLELALASENRFDKLTTEVDINLKYVVFLAFDFDEGDLVDLNSNQHD